MSCSTTTKSQVFNARIRSGGDGVCGDKLDGPGRSTREVKAIFCLVPMPRCQLSQHSYTTKNPIFIFRYKVPAVSLVTEKVDIRQMNLSSFIEKVRARGRCRYYQAYLSGLRANLSHVRLPAS